MSFFSTFGVNMDKSREKAREEKAEGGIEVSDDGESGGGGGVAFSSLLSL